MNARQASYLIVDDFLEEEAWTALWTEFQFCDLQPVSRTAGAWKIDDGVPLGGAEVITPGREDELQHDPDYPQVFPSETAIDAVVEGVLERLGDFAAIVGDEWAHIVARSYVYPAGSSLSWHGDDHELYSGAFIYYAHPFWNAHWGGELLLADISSNEGLPIMGHRFENEEYSRLLLESGTGQFVMPKPNRLVVLGPAPHMVAPVRAAAGQAVRASVSGFFLRQERDVRA